MPVARGRVELVLGVVQSRTGLFYVQTNDKCGIFTRVDQPWEAGKGFMGGTFGRPPPKPAQRVLRAIDIQTGKMAWELPQFGAGRFVGRRAEHGRRRGVLLRRQRRVCGRRCGDRQAAVELSDQPGWKASPMTYVVRQPAVRRRGVGPEHHRVRAAGLREGSKVLLFNVLSFWTFER